MKPKKTSKPFAKKSFGQNFLVDRNYIEKIIGSLKPRAGEMIAEIGAGRGALTEKLIESGATVVAVELERDMIEILRAEFGEMENFRLIESDALKVDFSELVRQPSDAKIKLVANLPYYISTAILQKLIAQRGAFSEMILMFQREVVERITARAASAERGFLTVLTEAFLDAEKLFDVPPSAFRPAPKVWSAVVRLVPKAETRIFAKDEELFRALVSAGFAQKRKTILNNLKNASSALGEKIGDAATLLEKSEIDANRRAETLELREWKNIYEQLAQKI